MAAAITKEDIRTFEFIFDYTLQICPQLSTSVFVLLVDGDRATWAAARKKFQKVCDLHLLFTIMTVVLNKKNVI